MSGQELQFVNEAFSTNWIAPLGPHVDAFEKEFCNIIGAPHAAALSSGTAALHLALRLVGIGPGDRVYCSTFTFSASVNPILYEGARPVFIDSEEESWNMDPALLEAALKRDASAGRLPKAVIVVHLYGQSAQLDPIGRLCAEYNVPLIEDAAEALGATYAGRDGTSAPVSPGTWGDFGAYSFNGNKIITTSGGGMLVSRNGAAIDQARFLATQARDPAPHYQHSQLGYNYRLSNVLAGIGRGQLTVLPQRVDDRRANFEFYQRELGALPGIAFMPEARWGRATRWLTCVTIDPEQFGADREAVRLALAAQNIESRPVWKPMHQQPIFQYYECYDRHVSDRLFDLGLCLPSGSNLRPEDLERVVSVIKQTCGGH